MLYICSDVTTVQLNMVTPQVVSLISLVGYLLSQVSPTPPKQIHITQLRWITIWTCSLASSVYILHTQLSYLSLRNICSHVLRCKIFLLLMYLTYIYIPGTPITSFFEGQTPQNKVFSNKNKGHVRVPGID